MKKWSVGVLGASDIAFKKFLPALEKSDVFSFAGIAARDPKRCEPYVNRFGGKTYPDYLTLIRSSEIDCVYVPLPPALHAKWGEEVLIAGKHLLMEKPFTTSLHDTNRLLALAKERGAAVHENYMFHFHHQIQVITNLINSERLGKLRMIRAAFTFPFRGADDFRYQKEMGGGALLDCGGYPLAIASHLLGVTAQVEWANLIESKEYGVDTGGSAILKNEEGLAAHIFFGMDDTYRCELEVWGSKASLYAPRVFTAPSDLPVVLEVRDGKTNQEIQVGMDDQFLNSLEYFKQLIKEPALREEQYRRISRQSELVEQIRTHSGKARDINKKSITVKQGEKNMNKIRVVMPSMPPFEEYIEEIRDIWDSRWLTHTGPKHQALTKQLSELYDGAEVSLFCNGHMALEAALSLFPAGSEVITTPFTFASTTLAIARCGLVPVFCDIEPELYTIDPEKIEPLITDKTVAILPVHVYGNLCDWHRIGKIANKHSLKVIYDAAHAFGVKDGNINVGNLGDCSMLSFHATKVLHSIEGGCLIHNSPELSKSFAAWRQFGMYDGEQSEILGTNAKLTEFAAAMGLCNLRHLKEQIEKRRVAVARYRERLSEVDGLVLCPKQTGVVSNYAYFPVQILEDRFGESRDELVARLAEQEIFARKYFYPLTSQMPYFHTHYTVQETPVAEKVSEQILCLPLYADLTEDDVDRVCDVILSKKYIG